MTTPPGYYPAQGDPPGTVRYWDGANWSPEPQPPPPGYNLSPDAHNDRFAKVGIRIGATLIDGVVALVVSLPFLVGYIRDVFDDIDAGGDGQSIDPPGSVILVSLGLVIVFFLMTAYLGGTPGKLALGLRVTLDDGATTPPGLTPAALRSLPGLAGAIPGIGPVVAIGIAIASLVMVSNDDHRRSVYDRVANTRVVHKNRI